MSQSDFSRLERKVDQLTDAINKLVLIEERQATQAATIADISTRLNTVERSLATWVNRGMGVWAAVIVAWSLYQKFY